MPVDLPGDPLRVVRALAHLAGTRRLTALSGGWAGGPLLLTADPTQVLHDSDSDHSDSGDSGDSGEPDGALLERLLARLDDGEPVKDAPDLPVGAVGGGWVLLLGHRLGRVLGRVRTPVPPEVGPRLPSLHAAFHDHLLRFDGGRWWAESLDPGDGSADRRAEALAHEALAALLAPGDGGDPRRRSLGAVTLQGVPDASAHMAAVERVVTAVRAGDIAQANVCTRFGLRLRDGGPAAVHAWTSLVEELRPDRAVLVTGPWGALVGASPETYVSTSGRRVTSSPIKGTRPAGDDTALRASAKDTSENVMIVDLVRNDLSRVCEPGSVRVEELLAVRTHTGVEHLVSRVAGTLLPGTGAGAVVRATFPPGSVTGTPKQRATEVTDEVEAAARGAHTGAVGLVSSRGTELAVTIRSLEVAPDGSAALGVGGGIVADSTPAEEWHEVLVKAAPLLSALGVGPVRPSPTTAASKGLADPSAGLIETVLAVDGRAIEVADHAARLRRSAWELTGRSLTADVEGLLAAAAAAAGAGAHRLRVRAPLPVGPGTLPAEPGRARDVVVGEVAVEVEPWQVPVGPRQQQGLVLGVVDAPPDGLERHKYADRSFLDAALAGIDGLDGVGGGDGVGDGVGDVDDVAFRAAEGLLETTRACLLAVLPGPAAPVLVTPACDGRVLPGTTRQVLVDLARRQGWEVRLGPLDEDVLTAAEGLVACNALRGAQWVREVGAHRWASPSPALVDLAEALLQRWRLPAG